MLETFQRDLEQRLPGRVAETLQLELRQQDVARLDQRNVQLERELRRVERHNLNLLKDNIVLKKQLAEMQPNRRGRRAKASDIP